MHISRKKGSKKGNKMSDNKITSIFTMVVAARITWGDSRSFFQGGYICCDDSFCVICGIYIVEAELCQGFFDICIRNAFLAL